MTQIVTIFKNLRETDTPFHRPVLSVLDRIKNGDSKDLILKIRNEKEKQIRNDLKRQLPAICFSGRFSKREDASLIEHSGLICLDFDGYKTTKDLLQTKERLSKDGYVFSVFVSPSGNGLKVLVKIPDDSENHVNYFNSLEKHFDSPEFDRTSKNVSRVCYESYDPQIYINENSSIWSSIEEREYHEMHKGTSMPTIPITDENKIADILVKWWTKKFPMVEGQRNQNTYVLAMAFNDYGVNKDLASYILTQYAGPGFSKNEIDTTITSAYSHTENFGTKYYEDEDRVNSIRAKLKRGVSKKEIRYQLQESRLDSDTIDSVLSKVDSESKTYEFWTKNDKGAVKIVHIKFKQFLEDNGFYKYFPENGNIYVFVRVQNNLIKNTFEKEIKDFVLNYLLDLDDMSIYNYFADQTRFFKDEFLSLLSTVDVYFIKDTKNTAYLYYRNGVVRVTPNEVKLIDYMDLGGYVWSDHVIDRDYVPCKPDMNFDYRVFIHNICGHDEQRVASMESTIGFLLHGFKNPSFCPAVILNDEVISDNPEGGTGKGIFMKAIAMIKKLQVVDGKVESFDRFSYQTINVDHQVVVFDDAKKHFDFEKLFSVITEGITLEKKNKDAIKIPFERSPKVAITTNYAIKGAGNSFARRKWELELHQHYHMDFTPEDEFGRMFFHGWNDAMMQQFDIYMIGCLQSYLGTGLVKSKFVNLQVRQLSAETCHEFLEWCGLLDNREANPLLIDGLKRYKNDLYFQFIEEYPDYAPKSRFTISRNRFYRWLNSFSIFKYGTTPEEGRDSNGRWIFFTKPKKQAPVEAKQQRDIDYDDDDLPDIDDFK